LVLGGTKEWTSAIKHPFLAVWGVAAFAMVVTRLAASADGKPWVCHCAVLTIMLLPVVAPGVNDLDVSPDWRRWAHEILVFLEVAVKIWLHVFSSLVRANFEKDEGGGRGGPGCHDIPSILVVWIPWWLGGWLIRRHWGKWQRLALLLVLSWFLGCSLQ
jgi:hypothetical protein